MRKYWHESEIIGEEEHHQPLALLPPTLESNSNAWMGKGNERGEERVSPHHVCTFTLDKLLLPTALLFESEVPFILTNCKGALLFLISSCPTKVHPCCMSYFPCYCDKIHVGMKSHLDYYLASYFSSVRFHSISCNKDYCMYLLSRLHTCNSQPGPWYMGTR